MNPNTQDRDQQDAREIESDMRRRRGETFWDILPGELEANRKRVYDYIKAQGPHGATDEECQMSLGMSGNTQRPRRVELFQHGKICMAAEMRRTRAGRKANVWVAI